jgi:hypothetical protein
VRALGFDPDALFERAVGKLRASWAAGGPGVSLEEAITCIENEWMSIPGTPTVPDTEARLPTELSLQMAVPVAARRRPVEDVN